MNLTPKLPPGITLRKLKNGSVMYEARVRIGKQVKSFGRFAVLEDAVGAFTKAKASVPKRPMGRPRKKPLNLTKHGLTPAEKEKPAPAQVPQYSREERIAMIRAAWKNTQYQG
jgi:hypothetical protein